MKKTLPGFMSEVLACLKGSGYFGICYKNDDLFVVRRGITSFSKGQETF